jgi:hypothetical protein
MELAWEAHSIVSMNVDGEADGGMTVSNALATEENESSVRKPRREAKTFRVWKIFAHEHAKESLLS